MYTLMSKVSIVKDILQDPALKSNQDPLENFFGRVWQSGGWSQNPSSKRVQEATDVIQLQTSSVMDEVRSSSQAKRRVFGAGPKVDDTPLPKCARKPCT